MFDLLKAKLTQPTLLPKSLDSYAGKTNPVRVINVFCR